MGRWEEYDNPGEFSEICLSEFPMFFLQDASTSGGTFTRNTREESQYYDKVFETTSPSKKTRNAGFRSVFSFHLKTNYFPLKKNYSSKSLLPFCVMTPPTHPVTLPIPANPPRRLRRRNVIPHLGTSVGRRLVVATHDLTKYKGYL